MKKLILFTLILSGCTTTTSEFPATVEGIKKQERQKYYRACMKEPEKFGFPMSWDSYNDLLHMGFEVSMTPQYFCSSVSKRVVK